MLQYLLSSKLLQFVFRLGPKVGLWPRPQTGLAHAAVGQYGSNLGLSIPSWAIDHLGHSQLRLCMFKDMGQTVPLMTLISHFTISSSKITSLFKLITQFNQSITINTAYKYPSIALEG